MPCEAGCDDGCVCLGACCDKGILMCVDYGGQDCPSWPAGQTANTHIALPPLKTLIYTIVLPCNFLPVVIAR